MRVSTDPSDPAYVDDRPRRVWLNDREVDGWITADEFRRCVVTATGALHGSVLIERLPKVGEPVAEPAPTLDIGLSGISVAAAADPEPTTSFAPHVVVPVIAKAGKRDKKRGWR